MFICGCLLVGISWACPLLHACTYPLEEFILRPGVLRRTLSPDMIKVELTYVPIKGGIVYSDVNRFFYDPGKVLVLPPYDVEIVSFGIVSSL